MQLLQIQSGIRNCKCTNSQQLLTSLSEQSVLPTLLTRKSINIHKRISLQYSEINKNTFYSY